MQIHFDESMTSLALRCAPAVAWVAVFVAAKKQDTLLSSCGFGCSSGSSKSLLPDEWELAAQVTSWGFRLADWRLKPATIVTHLFVHASLGHLTANVLSFVTVSSEFRPRNAEVVVGGDGDGQPHQRQRRMLSPLPLLSESIQTLIALAGVWAVGGAAGGILGYTLHCWHAREKWKRQYGLGFSLVERVVGHAHKFVSDRVYLCGASAGICAVSGFNMAYHRRYISGMFMLVTSLVQEANHMAQTPALLPATTGGGSSETSGMQVGHAAHLGGFVVGALIGVAWRFLSSLPSVQRWLSAPQQQQLPDRAGRRLGGAVG